MHLHHRFNASNVSLASGTVPKAAIFLRIFRNFAVIFPNSNGGEMLALMPPPLPSERTASVICPKKIERSKQARITRILREALWSASPLRRFWLHRQKNVSTLQRFSGFTLLELLIVVAIIALLLVLLAPAFTTIKGGTDVTSSAYTIKGVLDTARTYSKANNAYTWVGFYEEDVSQPSTNPATAGTGRVVISIVASKDGTRVYDPNNLTTINPTQLIQVGKLTKIENAHLWTHTDAPTGLGSTFDTRPNVASTYCIGNSSPAGSGTPFQYPVGNPAPTAQYTFQKAVQFSPRGEARINNDSNSPQRAAEIAFEATHGVAVPGSIPANVAAVQVNGFAGDVTIYRR